MLNQFINERNLSASTIRNYVSAVDLYEKINCKTLDELIDEAEREEIEKIRWKDRELKKRLIDYRSYLYRNKVETTAKKYLNNIKTIYRHFEIELYALPSFNSKQINKSIEIRFKDLPTRMNIKDAYNIADSITGLIIMLIVTSGMSKADILDLTVDDFLKADELIPTTFYLTRQKTGKEFFTFTTPKTSNEIKKHIIKYNLSSNEVLFNVSDSLLTKNMAKINSKLKLGRVGNYSIIRCHMLRKYHASNLLNNTSFTIDEIDTLQGRCKKKIHRSYFLNDEEKLKEKYMRYINAIDI